MEYVTEVRSQDTNLRLLVTFLLFSVFCLLSPASAQTVKEPVSGTIRIGKHADFIRIVLSTSDEYVQKASVILTGDNSIKVDFQSPIVFKTPEKGILKSEAEVELTGGIKITVKGSSSIFIVENLDDINVSKLLTPARLVIDAYISKPVGKPSEEGSFADVSIDGDSIQFESFVIDAGHGGYDTGIRGKNFAEKDFVLSFAREFAHILDKKGKKVFLTRKGDNILSIRDRIKAASRKSPDIFISIHLSSKNEFVIYIMPGDGSSVRQQPEKASEQTNKAVQQATLPDANKVIANAVANALKNEFRISVGQERLPVPVITNATTAAFLIELPNPEKFGYDKKTKECLINALLRGIAHPSIQAAIPKGGKGQVSAGGK